MLHTIDAKKPKRLRIKKTAENSAAFFIIQI